MLLIVCLSLLSTRTWQLLVKMVIDFYLPDPHILEKEEVTRNVLCELYSVPEGPGDEKKKDRIGNGTRDERASVLQF